jgi:hypothetical protein
MKTKKETEAKWSKQYHRMVIFSPLMFILLLLMTMTTALPSWAAAPSAPTLVSPADGATFTGDNTIDLSWSEPATTNRYQIQVDNNSDFSSPEYYNTINQGWHNYDTTSALGNGTYYWRVRAGYYVPFTTEWSSWSAIRSFTVNLPQPPPAPTLVSPIDGSVITDTLTTLDWDSVSGTGAVTYRARWDDDTNLSSGATYSAFGSATDIILGLSQGTYYWQAQARDTIGDSSWASYWSFTVADTSANSSYTYTAAVSPTTSSVSASQSYTVTITNTTSTTRYAWSALISIPLDWSISGLSVDATSGRNWSGSIVGNQIQLEADSSGNQIQPDEFVSATFTATAPATAGPYTWPCYLYDDAGFDGLFTLSGSQPAVEVTGGVECGDGTVDDGEDCDEGAANGTDTSCCSATCTFKLSSSVCRASAGICDVAETCTGSSGACPADGYDPGNICRASAGPCDVEESCTGSSAACPADAFSSDTIVCRPGTGLCDVEETCTGSSADCPADAFLTGTICRGSAGICDVVETCSGSSAACPPDGFLSGTTCRDSAGICDVAESCTGSGAACPADNFVTAGTECRATAGICDVAESCTGSGADCPADGFVTAGTECRADAGQCDIAENCTGSSAACPDDAFELSSTACTGLTNGGVCNDDAADHCSGTDNSCVDVFEPASTTCGDAGSDCTNQDYCDGSGGCTDNGFQPSGTACTDDGTYCNGAEICDGAGTCQSPGDPCENDDVCMEDTDYCCDPAKVTNPSDATITYGDDTSFSVSASGDSPLTIQWQACSTCGDITDSGGGVYSNYTSETLNLSVPPVSFSGNHYRAVVTNVCNLIGAESTQAELIVNPATLDVTADDKTSQYSDPLLELTYGITGFVNGEDLGTIGLSGDVTHLFVDLSDPITEPAGEYDIEIDGDLSAPNYIFDYNWATYYVTKEIVRIKYIGDTFKWVNKDEISGNDDDETSINFKAILREDDDGNPGNLVGLVVTFTLENVKGGSAINYDANVDSNGVVQVTTLPNIPAGLYEVTVRVKDNPNYTSAMDLRTITVADWADRTSKVNGSGTILIGSEGDECDDNFDATFGFFVEYGKRSPTGNFNFYYYVEEGGEDYIYEVKNNAWSKGGLFFFSDTEAYFESKATVKKWNTITGENVGTSGNGKFYVQVEGDMEEATIDTIAVQIWDGKGIVFEIGTLESNKGQNQTPYVGEDVCLPGQILVTP